MTQPPKRTVTKIQNLWLVMKSLLPQHLLDLFKKKDKSREFSADLEFNMTVSKIAKQNGVSEEKTLLELAKAGQQQLTKQQDSLLRWNSLTQREQEVVALVCMGQRNYEIAEILGIAHATVKSHLQNIFEKFGWRSRNEIKLALMDWDFKTWWDHHH